MMGLCILVGLEKGGCCNIVPWRREKRKWGEVGEKENKMGFGVVYEGRDTLVFFNVKKI